MCQTSVRKKEYSALVSMSPNQMLSFFDLPFYTLSNFPPLVVRYEK